MTSKSVTSRQLAVLEWIGEGCPAGVMEDDTYKWSARALQNRRLVTVRKKQGSWTAEITEAGQFLLENGRYPDGHWMTETKSERPYRVRKQRPVTLKPPTDQLIADVEAAGGRLHVPSGDVYTIDNLVKSAIRFGKLPPGYTLRWEQGGSWGERHLVMAPLPSWVPREQRDVPVPSAVRRHHFVVAGIKSDSSLLPLSKSTRRRALNLLHAICVEAEQRGYGVRPPASNSYHRNALVTIDVHGHQIDLTVRELDDRFPHVPTAKELREKERYSWARIPDYDYKPSGRISIRVLSGTTVQQDEFADTKRVRLEDRLGKVLFEVELRAAHEEELKTAREKKEAERFAEWQLAYDRAVIAAREEFRLGVLEEQEARWQWHRRMSNYLDALESHLGQLPDSQQGSAEAWLTWARAAVQTRHPFANDLGLPPDPAFTQDRLKPHMPGWPPTPPQ